LGKETNNFDLAVEVIALKRNGGGFRTIWMKDEDKASQSYFEDGADNIALALCG